MNRNSLLSVDLIEKPTGSACVSFFYDVFNRRLDLNLFVYQQSVEYTHLLVNSLLNKIAKNSTGFRIMYTGNQLFFVQLA